MNRKAKALHRNNMSAYNNGPTFAARAFEPFAGKPCQTAFSAKDQNPQNKRKSARRGVACEKPTPLTPKAHI